MQGHYLANSTFLFTPAFIPPALTVTSATIDPSGTSATLQIMVESRAAGPYVLVATHASGSSRRVSSVANTVYILDGHQDPDHDGLNTTRELALGTDPLSADTDGDGFTDGEEVEFGVDPLDKTQLPPHVHALPRVAASAPVAVLNTTDPTGPAVHEAAGAVVSVHTLAIP